MGQRICSVDECEKAAHYTSPEVCPMHYQRWTKHGSFDKPAPRVRIRKPPKPCSIDGCDKPSRARSWCSVHWDRWRRHGSPTARLRGEVVDGKRICTVCMIDRPVADFGRPDGDSWCRECSNEKQRIRARARYVPVEGWPAKCEQCDADFMANKKRWLFCSPECSGAGRHPRNVKHVQTRRARQRAATVEPFNPSDVYRRDGWICQICGDPIDRQAVMPHPLSRSIDHIVPLALGGEHSLRNVQAAHLGCNVRKGARLVG